MTPRSNPALTIECDDPRLADLVDAITAKLQAGQPIDLAAYAAEYPEYAERLESWFAALKAIVELGESFSPGSRDARETAVRGSPDTAHPASSIEHPASSAGVLGDYCILREIGRGGMGVVYEAEQISLGRRVALKVLPFAAMLDRQQLARFKNEARAAATLDHPNIVAIHSVGCERGVHYYAMQLIEGQSLAQVIAELRGASGEEQDSLPLPGVEYPRLPLPGVDHPHLPLPGVDHPRLPLPGVEHPHLPRPGVEHPHLPGVDHPHLPLPGVKHLPLPLGEGRGEGNSGSEQSRGASGEKPEILSPQSPVPSPQFDTAPIAHLSTLPDPNSREYFRTVAQLGIQAAEALDHAHASGVLHRDIKPANLLVDDTGKLWITDFGLARIEQDAGMTMTGDILGTLRYMSPEQALAKRAVVDHRSDIYSLGITLYELLTLQPAYTGDDRQELLRQIAFEEPRQPRQINARIPSDLQTIVQKAIEKEPADRYATAQEFANDLRRFVKERPIAARRPTFIGIARKWSRRHQAAVFASFIILALTSLGLALASVLIASERNAAVAARNEATEHFQLARDAVDQLMTRVADEELLNAPQMEKLRASLLTDALEFYQRMLKRDAQNVALQHEVALAQMRIGDILNRLNRRDEAAAADADALRRIRNLVARYPEASEYKHSLAKILYESSHNLAWLSDGNGDTTHSRLAETNRSEAVSILEELLLHYPNNAEYAVSMAEALEYWSRDASQSEQIDRLKRAKSILEPLARSNAATPEQRGLYADILTVLGLGLHDELGKTYTEEAKQILRALLKQDPSHEDRRWRLAQLLWDSANGYPPDNIRDHVAAQEESVSLMGDLVRDFPSKSQRRSDLALARIQLAHLYGEAGDASAAKQQLLLAKKVAEEYWRDCPQYRDSYMRLVQVQYRLVGRYERDDAFEDWLREIDEMRRNALTSDTDNYDRMRIYHAGLLELFIGSKLLGRGDASKGLEWATQGLRRVVSYFETATTENKQVARSVLLPTASDERLIHTLDRLRVELLNAGKSDAAAEYETAIETLIPPRELGDFYAASKRDYSVAAQHYQTAARLAPDDSFIAVRAAILQLVNGDRLGYEAICRQMLGKFQTTSDPRDARRTSWACTISPNVVGDRDDWLPLAELALDDPVGVSFSFRERGLAAYRAGDWEGTLKWCAQSRNVDKRPRNNVRHAINLLLEAMAQHRMARPVEAKSAYQDAVALAPKYLPDFDWVEWVYYSLLRREAETLLRIETDSDTFRTTN